MTTATTSLTKIPNKRGGMGSHLYEVFIPYQSTEKLYKMVDFIYNSYPKKYVEMLNQRQKDPIFTVEQLVNYWSRDSYSKDSVFAVQFEEEKDAAFFALAFGDISVDNSL